MITAGCSIVRLYARTVDKYDSACVGMISTEVRIGFVDLLHNRVRLQTKNFETQIQEVLQVYVVRIWAPCFDVTCWN